VALEQCGYRWHDYLNYVTDVTRPRNELWRRITKCCRRDIRRSRERGVVLKEENAAGGIQKLYDYIQVSYARSKVPVPDKSLFDAVFAHLPQDWYRVVIAYYQGEPVASSIDLVYGGMVYGWYGGTMRVPGIAANACITWDSIEWAASNGQRIYDFGGAGCPDVHYAPRDFKSKFGGSLVHHGRYRKVYSRWKLALAERAYSGARRFIAPSLLSPATQASKLLPDDSSKLL
jgi:predicted N-acyltransferase